MLRYCTEICYKLHNKRLLLLRTELGSGLPGTCHLISYNYKLFQSITYTDPFHIIYQRPITPITGWGRGAPIQGRLIQSEVEGRYWWISFMEILYTFRQHVYRSEVKFR